MLKILKYIENLKKNIYASHIYNRLLDKCDTVAYSRKTIYGAFISRNNLKTFRIPKSSISVISETIDERRKASEYIHGIDMIEECIDKEK